MQSSIITLLITFCVILSCVTAIDGESHRVTELPMYGPVRQTMYAGYIPTNTIRKGSLYYWFFEKQNVSTISETPIVLFLNGGPSCSSLIGCFEENIGPFDITDENTLIDNPQTWSRSFHVLFIDQPLGTGFSYAENVESYTIDQTQVSEDMYNVLHQFFELHPQYKDCPLYLTGESYAGKFVPELAHRIIRTEGESNHLKKILKGIAIGDGFSAPVLQRMIKGDQAYWTGLISKQQVEQIHGIESECIRWIQAGNTTEADSPCEDIKNYLLLTSGIINIYDVRRFDPSTNKTRLEQYLNMPSVRQAIHASLEDSGGFRDKFVSCQHSTVYHYLEADILRDVRHLYPILAKHMKVLLYNGNFDLQDGPIGTEQYIQTLNIGDYHKSGRNLWFVEGDVAGYEQCSGNFCFISVFGSGHFFPHDQRRNARVMMEQWIGSKPFCTPGETIPIKFTTLTPSKFLKYLKDPVTGEYALPCDVHQLVCTTVLKNCNGNGACINGLCECKQGYTGSLCERRTNTLTLGKKSATNVLSAQEWKYYTIQLNNQNVDKNELQIKAQWKNSEPQIAPLSVQIGEGIGNDKPSQKICVYGKSGGAPPTWNSFDFVVCEKAATQINFVATVNLDNSNSSTTWTIGIFNSMPNDISVSASIVQEYPSNLQSVSLLSNFKFWIICTIVALIIAGMAIGASVYFRQQAVTAAKEFSRL
jgi:vitellogenic carboxypeptidase-like protein